MTLDYVKLIDFKKEMTEDDIKSFVKNLSETNNDNDEVCDIIDYLLDSFYLDESLLNLKKILKKKKLRKFLNVMFEKMDKYIIKDLKN